ncbi:MAG: hypothetical protein CFE31_07720 [Rhizobiales bacterium PAR1]|nr:MAG: hypothetical protein CFE31_07720 [Rhizobiales bacterium PAR1]
MAATKGNRAKSNGMTVVAGADLSACSMARRPQYMATAMNKTHIIVSRDGPFQTRSAGTLPVTTGIAVIIAAARLAVSTRMIRFDRR